MLEAHTPNHAAQASQSPALAKQTSFLAPAQFNADSSQQQCIRLKRSSVIKSELDLQICSQTHRRRLESIQRSIPALLDKRRVCLRWTQITGCCYPLWPWWVARSLSHWSLDRFECKSRSRLLFQRQPLIEFNFSRVELKTGRRLLLTFGRDNRRNKRGDKFAVYWRKQYCQQPEYLCHSPAVIQLDHPIFTVPQLTAWWSNELSSSQAQLCWPALSKTALAEKDSNLRFRWNLGSLFGHWRWSHSRLYQCL